MALTAFEQLQVELLNRARLDPAGEAARLGISLNEGLAAGTLTATARQPLAINTALNNAADGHTNHMLATDQFNHQGIGDGTPSSRVTAAGYTGFFTVGENIAVRSGVNQAATTGQLHADLFIDAGIPGAGTASTCWTMISARSGLARRLATLCSDQAVLSTPQC